jgi:hypothetical protein
VYSDCDTITLDNDATLTKCFFDNAPGTGPQVDQLSDAADGDFDANTFTNMSDFAIEISETGPVTYNHRGIKYSGNGASGDIEYTHGSGLVTLNVLETGDSPGVTQTGGGTNTTVLNPVTTLIHVDDHAGDDLINARVLLEASDAAGDLPFEDTVTITHVTTTASVAHTTHGMIVNDYVVIRGADQAAYNGTFQITNVTASAYDYTMGSDPGVDATGTIEANGAVLQGLTDSGGDISTSRSWALSQNCRGYVRKSTSGTTRFKSFSLAGTTVDKDDGITVNVRLVKDE